jgi:hypothetical protein
MPHWLAPGEIARKNQGEVELFPSVSRRGNAEKKCQKRVNTRENGQMDASTSLWLQPAAHAQSIVLSGNFWCCSFSLLKVSQKCSQLIHMRFVSVLASGLETRNPFQNRQEKNEFYFSSPKKIFLTKKTKRACPRGNERTIVRGILPRRVAAPIRNGRSELFWLIASCAALLS